VVVAEEVVSLVVGAKVMTVIKVVHIGIAVVLQAAMEAEGAEARMDGAALVTYTQVPLKAAMAKL
jgi:hypothetical protein